VYDIRNRARTTAAPCLDHRNWNIRPKKKAVADKYNRRAVTQRHAWGKPKKIDTPAVAILYLEGLEGLACHRQHTLPVASCFSNGQFAD